MAIPEKRSDVRPAIRLNPSPELPDEPPEVTTEVRPPSESVRLEVRKQPHYELRSHQPSVEELIEPQVADPDFVEHDWGDVARPSWRLPWGWVVLFTLTLCASGVWAFFKLKPTPVRRNALQAERTTTRKTEAEEQQEAKELLERIAQVTREYYAATTVDELVKLTRHPGHVRRLMELHHQGQKIKPRGTAKRVALHPITVSRRANFWYQDVRLSDQSQRQMMIEVVGDNQPKIDWESEACYQPMPWDRFATERPANTPLDFRVFAKPDSFYSDEFTEADGWKSFLLTTNDSKESLFGYAKEDSEVGKVLLSYFRANPAKKFTPILKLSVPADVKSKRGVVIEKLVNPMWLHMEPPKSDD